MLEDFLPVLQRIAASLEKPTATEGFSNPDRIVYCNLIKGNGDGWYSLNGNAAITQPPVFTGQLISISFPKVERNDKEVCKFHLKMRANGEIITFESGHDCFFSKTVLAALAIASPEVLTRPIQLETYAKKLNNGGQTLAVSLKAGGEPLVSDWRNDDDWRGIAQLAISNVKEATAQ